MTDQFIGEIRSFGFNFAPVGWAQCNGQLLPLAQNTALFSIIGTSYGGDGKTTFGLPNLMGRVPLAQGTGLGLSAFQVGEMGGAATVALTAAQLGSHTHPLLGYVGRGAATSGSPTGASLSVSSGAEAYVTPAGGLVALGAQTVAAAGGGGAHNNMMPSLVVNICIALQGIFPSRG